MLIKEYRITLPMTVNEYETGHLYTVSEACKLETNDKEGSEVVKSEPFENYALFGDKFSKGHYTYKIYRFANEVPSFIRAIAPIGSLEFHEESWNAYPYCRTVITNPKYMKDKFVIKIESMHCADNGNRTNVHDLPPELMKKREIVYIDIANDKVAPKDYKKNEDPTKLTSEKSGRGPLVGNWMETIDPVMTCYKLVTVEFKWFGLQNKVESYLQNLERNLFLNFHRKLFCSIDEWCGLSVQNIKKHEESMKKKSDDVFDTCRQQ